MYRYLLTVSGLEEMAGELVATTGVMHRVNLVLTPEVMSVEPSTLESVKKIG